MSNKHVHILIIIFWNIFQIILYKILYILQFYILQPELNLLHCHKKVKLSDI